MNSNGPNNQPSRIVYLGSIPYDQTEQQILDLCNNVGPVINLRMMFDPINGKSKGYAFIEFKDLESSASAVRNLNGYPLGNRLLKCGYSSNNDISGSGNIVSGGNTNMNDFDDKEVGTMRFPGLPQGVDVNINMTTPAMMISSELSKMNKDEQLSMLTQWQVWSRDEPELSVQLLREYPQLTFVIAELLLTNGICQVDDLTALAIGRGDNKTSDMGEESLHGEEKLSSDPQEMMKQKELLRQVLQLTDSDINVLPDNEKSILWDLKQKVMKGEYGLI